MDVNSDFALYARAHCKKTPESDSISKLLAHDTVNFGTLALFKTTIFDADFSASLKCF